MPYADPQLTKTAEAAEWLSRHDRIQQQLYSKSQFALYPYADATVLALQHHCSVPFMTEALRFPQAANEARRHAPNRLALPSPAVPLPSPPPLPPHHHHFSSIPSPPRQARRRQKQKANVLGSWQAGRAPSIFNHYTQV